MENWGMVEGGGDYNINVLKAKLTFQSQTCISRSAQVQYKDRTDEAPPYFSSFKEEAVSNLRQIKKSTN